jgi:peptide/nickel transport system substrate-binding protein
MKRKIGWIFLSAIIALSLISVSLLVAGCEEEVTPPAQEEEEEQPPAEEEEEGNWWDKFGEPQYGGTITIREQILGSSFDCGANPGIMVPTLWLDLLWEYDWTVDREEEWPFKTYLVPADYYSGTLVESWEMPDAQTIICKLREGIYWQDKPPVNGREFTADDVVFHFDRLLGTGSGFTEPNPYKPFFSNWDRVTATDKYTFVMKFKTPSAFTFQNAIEFLGIAIEAPESVQDGSIDDWQQAVGTGPWLVTDFVENSSVTYSKNPDYWGTDPRYPENQVPYADELKILEISDVATTIAALRSGQLDALSTSTHWGLEYYQANSLMETNPELELDSIPTGGLVVVMRCDTAPFTDIRVRKALQMAINREEIAAGYYGGAVDGIPCGLISPYHEGFCFAYEDWPQSLKDEYGYNPDRAKELLAEAAADGVFEPNELGGFDTNVVVNARADVDLVEIIQSYFSDIGVVMDIEVMEANAAFSYMSEGLVEQMCVPDSLATGGTGTIANALGNRKSTATTTNFTANNDAYYDSLVDQFNSTTDIDEAMRIAVEADRYSLEQHWHVATFPLSKFNAWQPYLLPGVGEFAFGYKFTYNYYRYLWIDQDLKTQMGR